MQYALGYILRFYISFKIRSIFLVVVNFSLAKILKFRVKVESDIFKVILSHTEYIFRIG
jgi:hypothetical protein